MKNTPSKNVPGKTLFQVVDEDRQQAGTIAESLNEAQSGINPTKSQDLACQMDLFQRLTWVEALLQSYLVKKIFGIRGTEGLPDPT